MPDEDGMPMQSSSEMHNASASGVHDATSSVSGTMATEKPGEWCNNCMQLDGVPLLVYCAWACACAGSNRSLAVAQLTSATLLFCGRGDLGIWESGNLRTWNLDLDLGIEQALADQQKKHRETFARVARARIGSWDERSVKREPAAY